MPACWLEQALEAGTAATAGMGPAFEEHTRHLSPLHAAFLCHWLQLIDLEEGGLTARRAEIWAMSGALYDRLSSATPAETCAPVPLTTNSQCCPLFLHAFLS